MGIFPPQFKIDAHCVLQSPRQRGDEGALAVPPGFGRSENEPNFFFYNNIPWQNIVIINVYFYEDV